MQAVLLAAGRSTRFWPLGNGEHKSVYTIAGRPLLLHTLHSLAKTGLIDEAFVVHAPNFSVPRIVPERIGSMKVACVQQTEPKGTGDALYCVSEHITGDFVLVWPDMVNADFFVRSLVRPAKKQGVRAAMLGAPTKAPWNFGIIRKDGEFVREVVEKPVLGSEPSSIKRVGVELLPKEFLSVYESLPEHHETDLVDALNRYAQKNDILLIEQKHDVPVLKYPWDVFTQMNVLSRSFSGWAQRNAKHPAHITTSKQSVIEGRCEFGKDVVLRGAVYIGEGSVIGEGTQIIGPAFLERKTIIGSGCKIARSSVGEGAIIRNNTQLEDSIVATGCRVGEECIVQGRLGDRSVIEARGQSGEIIVTGRTQLGVVMGKESVLGKGCRVEPGVMVDIQSVIKDNTRLVV